MSYPIKISKTTVVVLFNAYLVCVWGGLARFLSFAKLYLSESERNREPRNRTRLQQFCS